MSAVQWVTGEAVKVSYTYQFEDGEYFRTPVQGGEREQWIGTGWTPVQNKAA